MDYKHFSHPHNLTIHRPYEIGPQVMNCSGCDSSCDNTATAVHACHRCNFFLHDHCANAGRYVKHPSHKPHPLILLPYPTYAGGTFICNACGRPGNSFSYCCTLCEFDLHVSCSFLPVKVTHVGHQHELGLFYGVPVVPRSRRGSSEYCNICRKVLEERHWAYCCEACDFHVHTACATTEVVPGLYQDAAEAQADGGGGGGDMELTEEELIRLYNIKLAEQLAQTMASLSTRGG